MAEKTIPFGAVLAYMYIAHIREEYTPLPWAYIFIDVDMFNFNCRLKLFENVTHQFT